MIIPNLWGGIIGHPSTLKSPALAETLSPLARLENEARKDFQEKAEEYEYKIEAHKIIKEAKISKIKSDMKVNKMSMSCEDVEREMKEVEKPYAPLCKRFKTKDATIEKMTELLEQNPRGMMLFRDELMGLLTTWDRQGREADRSFYLEAWNGYGSHTTDRIERGTTHCDNMCVSIVGGTQPSKILGYLQKAIRGIENDGLVQRLQLFVCPDDRKEWQLVDTFPNKEAQEKSSVETGQAQKPFVDKNKPRRPPPPLLLKLYDLFPKVFDINNPKPLKRGVNKDILERLPDDLAVTESHLKKVMKRHVMGSPYCWAILKGTHRFDLDGNEVDVIDEQTKESAQNVIKWKREMRQQQKAQISKKETGGVT